MEELDYLRPSVVDAVAQRFHDYVPSFFGQNLVFAFIFGGFAKGYATARHDVDMLICLNSFCADQVERFLTWYFALHADFQLPPDNKYPGEIMVIATLEEKIQFLESRLLRREIETLYEYEAILWGDALSGPKLAIIGDLQRLQRLEDTCQMLATRWRREIAQMLDVPDPETFAHLDLRRLFKKAVVYHKTGDNTKPNE